MKRILKQIFKKKNKAIKLLTALLLCGQYMELLFRTLLLNEIKTVENIGISRLELPINVRWPLTVLRFGSVQIGGLKMITNFTISFFPKIEQVISLYRFKKCTSLDVLYQFYNKNTFKYMYCKQEGLFSPAPQ